LEPWDEQLPLYAIKIFKKRLESLEIIKEIAKNIHKSIANEENLSISYLNSINIDNDYLSSFKQKQTEIRPYEIQRGMSLIGPHRDDLVIAINNQNVRFLGSQGQQRTAAISLRMAEMEYIYQIFLEYPILLLDDIFSELDDKRKTYLLNLLSKKVQIFLTGTRLSDFTILLNRAMVFGVQNGKVCPL
jgi:DNA replication and repair protein RecF